MQVQIDRLTRDLQTFIDKLNLNTAKPKPYRSQSPSMSPRRKAVLLARTDAVSRDIEERMYIDEELTADQLYNKTKQALAQPMPRPVLPILSGGSTFVKHNRVKPNFKKTLEQSEKEFWDVYMCRNVPKRHKKKLTLDQLIRQKQQVNRIQGEIYEKDIEQLGTYELINRGLIPKEVDLDPVFQGDVNVRTQQEVMNSPELPRSPEHPEYKYKTANEFNKIKEAVDMIQEAYTESNSPNKLSSKMEKRDAEQLTQSEISSADQKRPNSKVRLKNKFHWTQLTGNKFETAQINSFIDDFHSRNQGMLFGTLDLSSIPIINGQVIKNVQYKAIMQKYCFMQHILIAILDQVDQGIKNQIKNGQVITQKLVQLSYQVFFGEAKLKIHNIEDLVKRLGDDLASIQEEDEEHAKQSEVDNTKQDLQNSIKQDEKMDIDDQVLPYYTQPDNLSYVTYIQRYHRLKAQQSAYLKNLQFEQNKLKQEFDNLNILYNQELEKCQKGRQKTENLNVWNHRGDQVLVLFQVEDVNLDLIQQIIDESLENTKLVIILFKKFPIETLRHNDNCTVELLELSAQSLIKYLNAFASPAQGRQALVDEIYSYVLLHHCNEIQEKTLSNFTHCVVLPEQCQSHYFVQILMKLRIAANIPSQKLLQTTFYQEIFGLPAQLYQGMKPQLQGLPSELFSLEIDQKKPLKQQIDDALQPENKVKQLRYQSIQLTGGQNLLRLSMGGSGVSYVMPGNTVLQVFQEDVLQLQGKLPFVKRQKNIQPMVLQTFPYRQIQVYFRVSFFLSMQILKMRHEELKTYVDVLFKNNVSQALPCDGYIGFEHSMSYGEVKPFRFFLEQSLPRQQHIKEAFFSLFYNLINMFQQNELQNMQINIGAGVCENGHLFFNGVSFGALEDIQYKHQNASENEDETINMSQKPKINYTVSFNGISNISTMALNSKILNNISGMRSYECIGKLLVDRFHRLQSIVNVENIVFNRNIDIYRYYKLVLQSDDYTQLKKEIQSSIAMFQEESTNEEIVKQIVQKKVQYSVQESQAMMELNGSSVFVTAVINNMKQQLYINSP